jgi:tetratricopeptide (TPR) repeat protein
VSDAIEYVLELSGIGSFPDITLEAGEIACTEDARGLSGPVCSAVWPVEWSLAQGKPYFLTVNARMSLASPLRSSEKSSLRTLDAERAATIKDEVAAVEMLKLSDGANDLLLAGIYAEAGLYAQAIPLMQSLLAIQPTPVLHISLGDAYRATDLQRYAFFAYQDALALLDHEVDQGKDDPAVRAAAAFGLGQVEYNRLNNDQAQIHFSQAVELLTPLGATEELAVATYGLGKIEDSRCNMAEAEQHYASAMELYTGLALDEKAQAVQEALDAMHERCAHASTVTILTGDYLGQGR